MHTEAGGAPQGSAWALPAMADSALTALVSGDVLHLCHLCGSL